MPTAAKYWIGVASRDHVRLGVAGGYCQLCHGKAQPLKRMNKGDWIVYYSSKQQFNAAEPCQKFTALGEVVGKEPYDFAMAPGFVPYRRDVRFVATEEIDIRPLIEHLSFIRNKASWGYAFRFGHLEIPESDFKLIASKMINRENPTCIDGRLPRRSSP
jgi:predicted RNA-binding protein